MARSTYTISFQTIPGTNLHGTFCLYASQLGPNSFPSPESSTPPLLNNDTTVYANILPQTMSTHRAFVAIKPHSCT